MNYLQLRAAKLEELGLESYSPYTLFDFIQTVHTFNTGSLEIDYNIVHKMYQYLQYVLKTWQSSESSSELMIKALIKEVCFDFDEDVDLGEED